MSFAHSHNSCSHYKPNTSSPTIVIYCSEGITDAIAIPANGSGSLVASCRYAVLAS